MLDTQLQARFTRGCATAAFDYAAAASQAYFEGTQHLVTMWADAFAAAAPDAEPRSWYRPPADAGMTARRPSDNWAKPSQAWFPAAPRSATAPAATTLATYALRLLVSNKQAARTTPADNHVHQTRRFVAERARLTSIPPHTTSHGKR